MKKSVSALLLALVLMLTTLFSVVGTSVFAANEDGLTPEDVVFIVQTVTTDGVNKGETFTIDVMTNAVDNIAMVEFYFAYDNSKVKAIDKEIKGCLADMDMKDVVIAPKGDKDKNPATGEVWITGMILEQLTSDENEVIATITFEALVDLTEDVPMAAIGEALSSTHELVDHNVATVDGGLFIAAATTTTTTALTTTTTTTTTTTEAPTTTTTKAPPVSDTIVELMKQEYIVEGAENVTISENVWTVTGDFAMRCDVNYDINVLQHIRQKLTTNTPVKITVYDQPFDKWIGLYDNWVGPSHFPVGTYNENNSMKSIYNWNVSNNGWDAAVFTDGANISAIYFEFEAGASDIEMTLTDLYLNAGMPPVTTTTTTTTTTTLPPTATSTDAPANEVVFTLSATEAAIGDIVTVSVDLSENSYFTNATMYLEYDPNCMSFVEEGMGEIAPGTTMFMAADFPEENYVKAAFVCVNGITKGGTLVTFDFKVLNKGDAAFSLRFDECVGVDANGTEFDVNYTVVPCTASVLSKTYPDVRVGDWYYDAVNFVSDRGIMSGYKSGNFGAANNLQRQDFVVTIARLMGADLSAYEGKTGGLKDVNASAYYASAVAWAVDNNIVTGYKSGNFGVGDSITREQVATILYRAFGTPVEDKTVLDQFPDSKNISVFAKDAMAWAVENGLISGLKSGKISPTSGASRAQIATILMRMLET